MFCKLCLSEAVKQMSWSMQSTTLSKTQWWCFKQDCGDNCTVMCGFCVSFRKIMDVRWNADCINSWRKREKERARGGERERENLKGLVLEDSQKNLGTYNLYWEGNSMDGPGPVSLNSDRGHTTGASKRLALDSQRWCFVVVAKPGKWMGKATRNLGAIPTWKSRWKGQLPSSSLESREDTCLWGQLAGRWTLVQEGETRAGRSRMGARLLSSSLHFCGPAVSHLHVLQLHGAIWNPQILSSGQ